jgi:hypothetical protein
MKGSQPMRRSACLPGRVRKPIRSTRFSEAIADGVTMIRGAARVPVSPFGVA